jgi:hypothetical protein
VQAVLHGGNALRLSGPLRRTARWGIGLALVVGMLAALAPMAESAPAATRHEHDNSLPLRTVRVPVLHATAPDVGGRRMAGLTQAATAGAISSNVLVAALGLSRLRRPELPGRRRRSSRSKDRSPPLGRIGGRGEPSAARPLTPSGASPRGVIAPAQCRRPRSRPGSGSASPWRGAGAQVLGRSRGDAPRGGPAM